MAGSNSIGLIIGLIVVIVTGVGVYSYVNQNSSDDYKKTSEGESMEAKSGDVMGEESNPAMKDKAGVMEDKSDSMEKNGATMQKGEEASGEGVMVKKSGSYEAYSPEKLSLASSGDVLIFFHADWCPICRAIESDINRNLSKIPEGVHILKVNYDTATALRQKYGVTVQHTFVQVDASGNLIAKWSDASSLSTALAKIK